MGRLSNISGREAVKIFDKFGYVLDHQTGSHMILWHESKPTLSVPNHRELAPGLLRSLGRYLLSLLTENANSSHNFSDGHGKTLLARATSQGNFQLSLHVTLHSLSGI